MKTVHEVLKEVRRLGVRCTGRTVWNYHKLRLLPEAQKISGKGNVVYFPSDTAVRIWLIYFLTTDLGFSISEISRYPWGHFDIGEASSTFHGLPEHFVFNAKQRLQKAREDILKHIMEGIVATIGTLDKVGNVRTEQIDSSHFGSTLSKTQPQKTTPDYEPDVHVRKSRAHLVSDTDDDVQDRVLVYKGNLRDSRRPRP